MKLFPSLKKYTYWTFGPFLDLGRSMLSLHRKNNITFLLSSLVLMVKKEVRHVQNESLLQRPVCKHILVLAGPESGAKYFHDLFTRVVWQWFWKSRRHTSN